MKKLLILIFIPISLSLSGTTYYISPGGRDSYPGTISQPFFTLNKAWTIISAGDIVYLRGGTYLFPTSQELTGKNGTAGNLIKIWAYPGETPIITKAGGWTYYNRAGIYFVGNYFHWKGLEIKGFVQIDANVWFGFRGDNSNHNIFELLNSHHNGLGMCLVNNSDDNLVLNCDFHHNYDPLTAADPYGNADGIDISNITAGNTNTVRGCRFWSNSDDGIDLWNGDGYVLIDSCWSWMNGYREDGITKGGNGCGFKLGVTAGDYSTTHLRTVTNCLAFDNLGGGFTQNAGRCISWLFNNTAYHNAAYPKGYRLNFEFNETKIVHVLKNNIAYANQYPSNLQAIYGNCITSNNTWNGGVTVTDADFVNFDQTELERLRQANGNLPNIDFLNLVPGSDLIDAGVNVGLPYVGSAPDIGAFEAIFGASAAIPEYMNSIVKDATPSIIEINYNLYLTNNTVPAATDFTVKVNSKTRKVILVEIVRSTVRLTLENPISGGEIIMVTYTKPGSNLLQTIYGGEAASISTKRVTNKVGFSDGQAVLSAILYPNPAHEYIDIIIDGEPPSETLFVRFYSLSGTLIYKDFIGPGSNNVRIPISLSPGVYLVQIGSGILTMFAQKVVVVN